MAFRVIVAGMGARGREWVRFIREAPGIELAGCAEVDERVLREGAARAGVSPGNCFTTVEEALDRTRADAVIVATSLDRHVEPCQQALRRRVAVLVEKPFATSLRDARRLVALAEEQGVPLMVGQNYRYMRLPRTVRHLVRSGRLGEVGSVVFQAYRPWMGPARSLPAFPNSVLWEFAVHHVDLVRWMFGREIVGVTAETFSLPWSEAARGASLHALLTLEGDVHVGYMTSYDSRGVEFLRRSRVFMEGQETYLRVFGERGMLHMWFHWLFFLERGRWPRPIRCLPRQVPEAVLLQDLERAVRCGAEPDCSGRDNLGTVAVLEACARSCEEGRRINPQELLREPL